MLEANPEETIQEIERAITEARMRDESDGGNKTKSE